MPSKGDTQVNTFVGGLITEASPLSFPENASLDEINFKLKKDGTRERRLGIDYEDNFRENSSGLTAVQIPEAIQRFFRWETPGGSADVEIGIVQMGNILWFINLFSSAPSTELLNGGNSITLDIGSATSVYDFAVVNNDVILVSHLLNSPYILTYDDVTDTVSSSTSDIKIRDLYGVDDALADDNRPSILSIPHEYNLRNQGWSANIQTTCITIDDALACTKNDINLYPSNSDIWTLGKIEDVASADVDKYDPDTLVKNSVDLGLAAKGHFILDVYERGTSRANAANLDLPLNDREAGRVSTVATYAGRAFYSGIQSKVINGDKFSPKNAGTVFFSQVVRNTDDFVKCYQAADPTSSEISDIVDTDGGVISVLGAANIIKLMTVKQSLFVFAQNGVWEIKGDDLGFKATGFQVNRLTTVGVLSRDSIVETNGSVLYWAKEGIFSLAPDQFGVSWDATNLTLTTIQTLYDAIPSLLKNAVRGWYDQGNNQVRWLFQDDLPNLIGFPVQPLPPRTLTVGTPKPALFENNVLYVDCAVLDSTTYVIVAITNVGFTREINGMVATIPNTDSVEVTVNPETSMEATNGNWQNLSVAQLSETLIIVAAVDNVNDNVYALTYSVISGVITLIKMQLVVASLANSRSVKIMAIDSTRAIIVYNGVVNKACEAVIVEAVGTTITVGTPLAISGYTSIGEFDIEEDGFVAGRFKIVCRGAILSSFLTGWKEAFTIETSGSVISGLQSHGLIGYLWSVPKVSVASYSSTLSAYTGRFSTTGGIIKLGSVAGGGVITSINSTNQEFHPFNEVYTTFNDRVHYVYSATPTAVPATEYFLEMELFTFNGVTLVSDQIIRLESNVGVIVLNTSDKGLSATKTPMVYIDGNTILDSARTLVYEAGD